MRSLPALFAVLALSIASPAAASVVAHGLSHTALGAATLSSPTPASPALEITNLGSSGQDGVTIVLPGSNGVALAFGLAHLHSNNIVHRDLACRALVNGTTSVLGTCSSTVSGADLHVTSDATQAKSVFIELWNGGVLQSCQSVPNGTTLTVHGAAASLCAPGDRVACTTQRTRLEGAVLKQLSFTVQLPAAYVVDGPAGSFTCDQMEFRYDASAVPGRLTDCVCHWTSDGALGDVVLDATACPLDPAVKSGAAKAGGAELSAASGVLLSAGGAGGLHLASDGSGAPMSFALQPLATGASASAPLADLDVTFATGAFSSPPVSFELDCAVLTDLHDGTAPTVVTQTTTWTPGSLGVIGEAALVRLPQRRSCALYRQGAPVYQADDVGTVACFALWPHMHQTATHNRLRMSFAASTSQPCLVNGVAVDADSLVFTITDSTSTPLGIVSAPCTISGLAACDLVDLASVSTAQFADGGGRGLYARGPRQTVSLDGTFGPHGRRFHSSTMDSQGEFASLTPRRDGLEVPFLGAVSASVPMPVITIDPATDVSCAVYACDDGSCAPSSELDLGLATGQPAQLAVTSSVGGPLFLEANGLFVPIGEGDLDGDGRVDVLPTTAGGVRVASVNYQWISPLSERWDVLTQDPVQVLAGSARQTTSELHVWRNRPPTGSGASQQRPLSMFVNVAPRVVAGYGPRVESIAIDEPGVQLYGAAGPGVALTISGIACEDTWGYSSGEPVPCDLDGDGFPEMRLDVTSPPGSNLAPAGSTLNVYSDAGALGYALAQDVAGLVARPDSSRIECALQGVWGTTPTDVWTVSQGMSSGRWVLGGKKGADFTQAQMPLDAYLHGVLVGHVVDASNASVVGDAAPDLVVMGGDLNGDGLPDVSCSSFRSALHLQLGGAPLACDSLVMRLVGGPPLLYTTSLVWTPIALATDPLLPRLRIASIPSAARTVAGVNPGDGPRVALALAAPQPNPSLGACTLRFSLGTAAHVRAELLDVAGRLVATLGDGRFAAGEHALRWDGRGANGAPAAAGLYFVRVRRDDAPGRVVRLTRLR